MLIAYFVFMVLLLFGITIFVHELGHYLVARWCGMVVEVFSIGFGPALWKKEIGGITYKIGCIPFGGYVALPQMEPGAGQKKEAKKDTPAEKSEQDEKPERILPPIAPWKKILVALAGATGNMILAVLIAFVVYWGGKSHAPVETECVLGYVETNSVAYAEGLRMGEIIEAVNGSSVHQWDDFVMTAALADHVLLRLRGVDGTVRELPVTTEPFLGGRMVMGLYPRNYCSVLKVEAGSSAEKAGILPGDTIVEFDGAELYSREHLIDLVNEARDQIKPAKIKRHGEVLDIQVQPAYSEEVQRARIGVVFNTFDVKKPWEQIKSHSMLIVRLLKALVTPKEARNAAGAVGGPIAIFQMFWLYVQTSFIMSLWFTGLLNVNLAILNLLPIPVLDGGHVLFSLWEWITRRPLSERIVGVLVNVFATLLIVLFVFLTYRDIARWGSVFSKKTATTNPVEAVTNTPPPME